MGEKEKIIQICASGELACLTLYALTDEGNLYMRQGISGEDSPWLKLVLPKACQ